MATQLPRGPADWQERAAALFDEVRASAAAAGFPVSPALSLVDEPKAYPAYDDGTQTIRFGLPGLESLGDRMFWGYYAALLGADAPGDALAFAALSLPLVLSHEVGHHLRHRYGTHTGDHFVEEQVAQVLAVAWVAEQPRYRGALPEIRAAAARATTRLRRLTPADTPLEHGQHLDVGEILADEHLVSWRRLYRAERLAALHHAAVEDVLVGNGWVTREQVAAAGMDMEQARRTFDDRYMQDLAEYWHFGLAWLAGYLRHSHHPAFGDTLRRYLNP